MANILIVPVCAQTDVTAIASSIAAKLPDAGVFKALADRDEARRLIAQGKTDDWFDLLVSRANELNKKNIVIEGIVPNGEHTFLGRLSLIHI